MARSIWNGVISFGMVSIPVKLLTATESKDVAFHLLHAECSTRIRQLRWCPQHEREVGWDEVVRAYEYAKGEYVVMTDEDFEHLPIPSKNTIELSAFVEASEIDPVFYEKTYYLEPTEVGVKPYALLTRALAGKRLTAIAKIAIRNKERLCALRPSDGTLVLETLYYPDEIRVVERTTAAGVDVSDRELDMAHALIDLLSGPFQPEEYRDTYREAVLQVIESKIAGKEVVEPEPAPEVKVVDLVAALKASVDAAKAAKAAKPRRKAG